MSHRVLMFALLLMACSLVGCGGGSYHPVTGKATYKGEPMVGAQLFFHPVGDKSPTAIRPGAQVQADGSYDVMSVGQRGAPAGEYRITVFWSGPKKEGAKRPGFGGGAEEGGGPNFIKSPYSDPDNSPLTAKIQAGSNSIPVEIK